MLTLRIQHTGKTVNSIEPVIDGIIIDWFRQLETSWASKPEKAILFDIGIRIQFDGRYHNGNMPRYYTWQCEQRL